jgi:hypothetical protein
MGNFLDSILWSASVMLQHAKALAFADIQNPLFTIFFLTKNSKLKSHVSGLMSDSMVTLTNEKSQVIK